MVEQSECPLILVVDDDPILRLLAVAALEKAGFEVIETEGAAGGLAAFAARRPDLVLLDLVMPGPDGYEVCRQMRCMPSGAGVPIVVMTGLDDAMSIDRAYEVGATDFVTKPLNYGLLAHRLRYLLRAASAFRAARASTRRLGRAQQLAHLAQWELDLSTEQLRWSEEASTIFQIPAHALGDGRRVLLEMVHPEDRRRVEGALSEAQPHSIEYRIILPDGHERVVRQDAEIVEDPESGVCLMSGAAQDMTDLRTAEQRVRDLAYFDTLTGLPNRALLSSFLSHAIDEARRDDTGVAVLALDLDGFKRINDTFGHASGDHLLEEVARRIAACIRSSDMMGRGDALSIERQLSATTMASRLGGDEFVVVLSRVSDRPNAALIARRIAERLAAAYTIGETEVFLSSSIGIACYPECGTGVETLLEHADAAMYHAKEGGRNQVEFFTADIHDRARKRLLLENALRAALTRAGIHQGTAGEERVPSGACEFRLEYQPKVEVPSGSVHGAEALLRWSSRELGPVSPADFIPVAEEAGLIVALGEWVLRTACAQAKAWAAEGEHAAIRVAVNVSATQFRDPGFAQLVSNVLGETGLAPCLLELEITEGLLMQDTVGSRRVLDDLKGLGVRLALDDFGTGYSSLSYLARLPIDALKIDRSFIHDLDGTARSATITSAIIGLSRGLQIDVVVEGVETQAQLDFIAGHGTSEIQGYFFAKPMPADKLQEWRAKRARELAASVEEPRVAEEAA